jgi:hypothetical protein
VSVFVLSSVSAAIEQPCFSQQQRIVLRPCRDQFSPPASHEREPVGLLRSSSFVRSVGVDAQQLVF